MYIYVFVFSRFQTKRTSESYEELIKTQIPGAYLQESESSTGHGQAQERVFFIAP